MEPKIIIKRWWIPLPLPGYYGITLYPFIFMRRGFKPSELRHELIHIRQQRDKGLLRYLASYLLQYVQARREGLDSMNAYFSITWESEAYANQGDCTYLPRDLEEYVR